MAPRWAENLTINSSCSVLVGGSSFVKGWHEAYRQFVFEEHPKDGVDWLGNKSTSESIALSPVVSSFLGLSFLNDDFSLRVWMVFSDIYPRPVHPLSPFACRFLLVALSRFSFSLRGGPTVHCRIGLNGWCWSSGGGKRGKDCRCGTHPPSFWWRSTQKEMRCPRQDLSQRKRSHWAARGKETHPRAPATTSDEHFLRIGRIWHAFAFLETVIFACQLRTIYFHCSCFYQIFSPYETYMQTKCIKPRTNERYITN